MLYDIHGTIYRIHDVESRGKFFFQRVVLATDGQILSFEAHSKLFEKVARLHLTDSVDIQFEAKGREWINPREGKDFGKTLYFNTLQISSISVCADETAQPKPTDASDPATKTGEPEFETDDELDDLPF